MFLVKTGKLLGSDYSNPNTFAHSFTNTFDDNLAISISVGGKAGCHPHVDLNEDSVGYGVLKDRYRIIVLTDAYNGSEAGEMIVNGVLSEIDQLIDYLTPTFDKTSMNQAMTKMIFPISKKIENKNRMKTRDRHNRTQMSIVVFDTNNSECLWANFGDSRIYRTFGDTPTISPVRRYSLGYPMSKRDFKKSIVTGQLTIPNNEAILICSDGFPEAKYPEIKPTKLIEWLGEYETAEQGLQNFMNRAFLHEPCDNLSAGLIINSVD